MAYDELLAERVRTSIAGLHGITEKKMFGGIAFMLRGNMCCGIVKEELMVRLGREGTAAALEEPHTRPMDFTGKPLKTMIYVEPIGCADDLALTAWVEKAVAFAKTLPAK